MAFMELSARLGLDGSAFRAGLDKAKSGVASLRSSIGSGIGSQVGGMLGVAAIVAYAKSTVDLGGKISDTSARLGISAEELQRWTFAATQTGASAEDITSFFEKLTVAKAKALAGDKAAIASFKALGVSMDDLKKKKIADIALQVGKTMQTGNVEELLPSLGAVGGKGAGALIPAFKGDLETMMASAPVMSNEAVAKMDDAGDKIDEAMLRLRVPMAELLAALTPLIEFFVDGVRMIIAVLKDAGDTFVAVGTDLLAMAKLDFSFSASKAAIAKDAAEGGNNLQKLITQKADEMAAEEARTAAKEALKAAGPAAPTPEPTAAAVAKTKPEPLPPIAPTIRDSLANIGGFTMAQNREVLDVQKDQLSTLEKIAENTDKLKDPPATVDDGLD
jgi:hypothetical protein